MTIRPVKPNREPDLVVGDKEFETAFWWEEGIAVYYEEVWSINPDNWTYIETDGKRTSINQRFLDRYGKQLKDSYYSFLLEKEIKRASNE